MKSVLITSSILILLLAALRPLLRGRIDPRLQYALWLIIALRLLVPVELATSAYSALALLDRAEGPARAAQAIGQAHVPIPAQSYDSAYVQIIREYEENGVDTTQLSDRELERVDAQARERSQGATLAQLFEKYARPLWLGGAALTGLWFLLVNLRFRRRLRAAELAVIEPSTKLPVYVSDALLSPCLCGTFRPAIYITPHAVRDPDRLRHVLAHESAHYRHKDHWWALVRCLCLCLYWFDPLVWWAAALSRQDCELACDAGAIRRLGEEERIPYGRTLVDMIAAGRCSLMQTATTMTGGKRRVRERVRLIARRPKTVLAVVLALALVLGAAVGCTFTGAPEKPSDTQRKPQLDILQSRLNDIPQELQPQIVNRPEDVSVLGQDGVLASYWWDIPADWENEFLPWLLTVYQWDQARFEQHLNPQGNGGYGAFDDVVVFARDSDHYYVFDQPAAGRFKMEGAEEYTAAYQTIRAFAEKTVLETDGVEPYTPSAQPLDTLEARLLDVPETLRNNVEARADDGTLANYFFKKPGKALDEAQYLLYVERISQERLDQRYDGSPGVANGSLPFARGNGQYYVLHWNTSIEYEPEDAEAFNAAFRAVQDYAKQTVLETEGVEPFDLYQLERYQITAVMSQILAAPSVTLSLAPAGTSRVYAYPVENRPDLPISRYLLDMASNFRWEEAGYSTSEGADTLRVEASDGSASLTLKDGSYLVTDGDGNCWKGTYNVEDYVAAADTTPYDYVRRLVFDPLEMSYLRVTTVPDRGQSHEEVVREWIEGYEGFMTKTAPGSQYACTYVRPGQITADAHAWMEPDALEEFAQYHGSAAADYGKTWFSFTYSLIFVPVDQSEASPLWAGNTDYYQGNDAPEGALTWIRVAYMRLIDGNWVCENTGTGW